MEPDEALDRIGLLLTMAGEPSPRARTFSRAAKSIRELSYGEIREMAAENGLTRIEGVGPVIESVIKEAIAGETPRYLLRLEEEAEASLTPAARTLLTSLRGDCHAHSNWSDGHAEIEEMALTAKSLGHEYMALTDHSPRLTIARGLSPERLRQQLALVEQLNEDLAPFRILTGIECDILEDGTLDQEDELLSRLDVVVGSLHSLLRMEPEAMTERMVTAIANPHLDILGHCTGRLITGRRGGRPESTFDPEIVFAACAMFDKAVEINCRPERLDPPRRLLALAIEAGCKFAIDTDAHTTLELHWQRLGCMRGGEMGVDAIDVVNAWPAERLLAWTASHEA